jgi:hypothetical protein
MTGAITFVGIFSLNGTNFRTLYLIQPMNGRCKNVAAHTNNIASGENPDFIDHCGRSILYGSYGGKDSKRDHRNGFIYRFRRRWWGCHRESLRVASGRSVRPVPEAGRLSPQEGTMIAIRLTLGLIQRPAMTRAWHLWTVIIPRRTITGRLVRGQVWRRHDGRRWLYKKFSA